MASRRARSERAMISSASGSTLSSPNSSIIVSSPPADVVAGGLRVEIADRLVRKADVGADDLQQLLVRLAAVEELRHRDAQPLLEDLVRLAREDLSADVRRVAEVAEVADDPPFAKTGVTTVKSLSWPEVIQGSLVISTSPGPSVSGG